MAPEHGGDASLYDFLVEEPEMITTTTTHFDTSAQPRMGQQAISPPHRTSSQPQRPLPNDPRHASTTPVNALSTPPLPGQSRVPSRAPRPHLHGLDLHAQGPVDMGGTGFGAPLAPAPGSSMPMEWSLYGVAHPAPHMNPTQFDFELPSAMMPSLPQHSIHGQHQPMHPAHDPNLQYSPGIVSPMSIHSPSPHYAFNGWGDVLGHDSRTPTVTTPAANVQQNPWVDGDEAQPFGEVPEASHKRTPRSRRAKKGSHSAGSHSDTAPSPSSTSQNSRASITSKSTSVASTSTASSRTSKLRSASRTSKNSHPRPGDTPEDRRTRASHNLVEKQYRNRLNAQFESLLSALPNKSREPGAPGEEEDSEGMDESADRRVSKGEVLERARKHIQLLEREREDLERENQELQGSLRNLQSQAPLDRSPSLEFGRSVPEEGFHHSPEA